MKPTCGALAIVSGLALSGCAQAVSGGRPRLTAVAPDSVRIIPGNVTEVELRGSAFDVSSTPENVVHIGPLLFRGVPGTNGGTRLRVAIPATMPSAGEAPPSPLLGGRYAVFVTTTRGISDTLSLAIFMFGAAP